MAALHTLELRLRFAVVFGDMAAARAGSAGVVWRHRNEHPAGPSQFVFELSPELEPALIQNGFVQARLGFDVLARFFVIALCRLGHVAHLQVLDTHHRVVLADRGRGLVQVVAAAVGDTGVDALYLGFRFLPVVAEFGFAAHGPLVTAQADFVLFEARQRCKKAAVRERGKAGNAHVDAHGAAGLRHGLLDFPLGLDAHEPLAARLAHGDVLHRAQRLAAVTVAQPAQLGQEDAAARLIELDLLGIGVAKAVPLAFFLEARQCRPLGEEVLVGPLQVLECLLQRVNGCIGQPCRCWAAPPLGEQLAQPSVAELLLALLVTLLLQHQSLVEHKPARAGEAAHVTLLSAGGHQFVFEGLKALHGLYE